MHFLELRFFRYRSNFVAKKLFLTQQQVLELTEERLRLNALNHLIDTCWEIAVSLTGTYSSNYVCLLSIVS